MLVRIVLNPATGRRNARAGCCNVSIGCRNACADRIKPHTGRCNVSIGCCNVLAHRTNDHIVPRNVYSDFG